MKRSISLISLALMMLMSSLALADTRLHKPSGIQFWVPDNWTTEDQGAQLTTSDPKGEAALLFSIQDAKDTKTVLTTIDALLAEHAKDVKAQAPKKTTLNGMEASIVDATGKIDGKAVELSVVVIKTPSKKFLTILGVLESAKHKAHEANLIKIIGSLKPKA